LERLFPQTFQSPPVLSASSFLLSIPNNLLPNSWTSYPFIYSVFYSFFENPLETYLHIVNSLVADQANLKRIRQAPRRLRRHRIRQARWLLDDAYQAYLQELASFRNSRNIQNDPYSDSSTHSHAAPEPTSQARRLLDDAYQAYLQELASSQNSRNIQSDPHSNSSIHSHPTPEPIERIPQSVDSSILEFSPSPRPNTPPAEPDSPHSALTIRVRPDIPPPSISPPSYSPVYSLRPTSPANSTISSIEFVDEIHVSPPRPRYYWVIHFVVSSW